MRASFRVSCRRCQIMHDKCGRICDCMKGRRERQHQGGEEVVLLPDERSRACAGARGPQRGQSGAPRRKKRPLKRTHRSTLPVPADTLAQGLVHSHPPRLRVLVNRVPVMKQSARGAFWKYSKKGTVRCSLFWRFSTIAQIQPKVSLLCPTARGS